METKKSNERIVNLALTEIGQSKIRHLISERRRRMGIRDLPKPKKKWCWHQWFFVG